MINKYVMYYIEQTNKIGFGFITKCEENTYTITDDFFSDDQVITTILAENILAIENLSSGIYKINNSPICYDLCVEIHDPRLHDCIIERLVFVTGEVEKIGNIIKSNNSKIQIGEKIPLKMSINSFKLPIFGERFQINAAISTSKVTSICDENTFITENSMYKWKLYNTLMSN